MPKNVRVVPEDLSVSAATVDAQADAVRVKHASADSRIDSAQPGVPAASAAALSATVAKWQADSTTLFGQMVDHSSSLRAGSVAYASTDADNAATLKAAGSQIQPEIDV